MSWHVNAADLAGYAAGTLPAPGVWSVEAHLAACARCRDALDVDFVDAGWERLDASLDAPRPGVIERSLVAVGVPEHTGRLLASTPALRGAWLAAVTLTLALAAVLAHYAEPYLFLAVTPLLPVFGVAVSFGPGLDPTHEVTLVAPHSTFRLLMLRCTAVLAANSVLTAGVSLTLASYGVGIVGWFLPSLALTILTLLLASRLGAVPAAGVVGFAWLGVVALTGAWHSGSSLPYTVVGQVAIALTAVVGAFALRLQITHLRRLR